MMPSPSYPLTLPITIAGASDASFIDSMMSLKRATSVSESPFTGSQQIQQYQYALWTANLTCPPMRKDLAQAWTAFFLKLRGREGTFLLGDPDAKKPLGNITGTVTADGAASINDIDISISCTTSDITDAFKAGDYVQFGSGSSAKLHMVVEDADISSGSGTITVEPPLKAAISDGDSIIYNNAQGVFRLDQAEQPWSANQVSLYGITFSCTEAL